MSDFKQRLIAAALNSVAAKDSDTPMPRTSEYGIKAGAGLQWRDMTPQERDRNLDAAKHRRARLAKRIAEQVADRSATREAEHDEIDALNREVDNLDVQDPVRFGRCLNLVARMDRVVTKVAVGKFHHSRRLARGAFDKDDVVQHTRIAVALELTKSERDIDELETAAAVIDHRGCVDYDDTVPHAKWIMGVISNRAKSSIRHLCQMHPTINSIDQLDTMLANIGGVDSLISTCKADHAPGMTGYRFRSPGKMDPLVLAVALDQEITRRHLDDLADIILDDDKRRHDGTFQWSKYHAEVLAACGEPVRKFESEVLAASYARRAARRSFAWINEFITNVLAAYDGERQIEWRNGRLVNTVDIIEAHTRREFVPVIQCVDADAMAKQLIRVLADVLVDVLA